MMKKICLTVTNELNYDQRMFRICSSLANNGYEVTLVGIEKRDSPLVQSFPFLQKRLKSNFFGMGKLFYLEYNIRLFFFLLKNKYDIICAVDLDSLVPCFFISKIKKSRLVYDAHEYFPELEEVAHRPFTKWLWKLTEKIFVPKIKYAYTVNQSIAGVFSRQHKKQFAVIRNLPVLQQNIADEKKERYIIYQGWVNHGRGLEQLAEAMREVDCRLIICGRGDIFDRLVGRVKAMKLEEQIIFKGFVEPWALRQMTLNATIGVTLFSKSGLSNYYSLANRFWDYIHAGIPQIAVNYPEYQKVNSEFEVAVLIDDLSPKTIAESLNRLLKDDALYQRLQQNCLKARTIFNWENEEKKLLEFYKNVV